MQNLDAITIASTVLLYVFVIMAVAMDMYCMRISNRLILAGLISSFLLRIGQGGWSELFPYLGNILFPVITLYLLYLSGGLGAGDIKLFSIIGGFTNFICLAQSMIAAFVIGGALAAAKMICCRNVRKHTYRVFDYLISFMSGRYKPFERIEGKDGNLIHFALAIFLGLCLVRVHPLW